MFRDQALLVSSRCKASARPDQSGFTYIGLMLLIVIMGVLLATIGTVWHTAQQREKEKQLLFVGNQFRQAIAAYYRQDFNGTHQYPRKLEDLLLDRRYPNVTRYLRKIFYDPMTGGTQWGLIKGADGGITGVHSLSDAVPFKTANFTKQDDSFADQKHVSGWQFVGGATLVSAAASSPAIVPVAQPANSVPPAAPVPPPLPPDATPDQNRQRFCQLLNSNDMRICAAVAVRYGAEAGAVCMASANQRYAICISSVNAMLPALVVQYQ